MIKNLWKYFTIFIPVIIFVACNDHQNEKDELIDLKIDTALYEISPGAAVILASMHLQKNMSCLVSESFEKNYEKSFDEKEITDDYADLIENIINKFNARCDFYSKAIKDTLSVFDEIKSNKALPDELYVFSVFIQTGSESDNLYEEVKIGLFKSVTSCEELRPFAIENNMPTLKCRKWPE